MINSRVNILILKKIGLARLLKNKFSSEAQIAEYSGATVEELRVLLGEKRDVKAWMAWLEKRAHGEIDAIETPIGYIPKYDDLKKLFKEKNLEEKMMAA
mgnify:CR=1 FL=1